MKENEKNVWSKPEIIVLVRNKPEEEVVSGCSILIMVTSKFS